MAMDQLTQSRKDAIVWKRMRKTCICLCCCYGLPALISAVSLLVLHFQTVDINGKRDSLYFIISMYLFAISALLLFLPTIICCMACCECCKPPRPELTLPAIVDPMFLTARPPPVPEALFAAPLIATYPTAPGLPMQHRNNLMNDRPPSYLEAVSGPSPSPGCLSESASPYHQNDKDGSYLMASDSKLYNKTGSYNPIPFIQSQGRHSLHDPPVRSPVMEYGKPSYRFPYADHDSSMPLTHIQDHS